MRQHRPHSARGYGLIELLMVVAVTAILATLAYPSYAAQINKGRRTEAIAALYQVQQAQERWRADHTAYAPDLASLRLAASAAAGYRIEIDAASAHGYLATATAGWRDSGCTTLSLGLQDGQIVHGSTGAAPPRTCWNR